MANEKKTPKKTESKPKPTPKIVTPEQVESGKDAVAAKAEKSPEEIKAALKEIMQEAAVQTGDMLHSNEGERLAEAKPEASSYDPVMQNQRDFIPGTRRHDLTRLPEFAYDEKEQEVRRVSLPKEIHYVWVHPDKLDSMHSRGYRLACYDGGNQSGLAPGGLRGTNMFERTIDNHVRNGDTFLMFAPARLYEALVEEDAEQSRAWEMAAEEDHHNLGYRYGVRTFKEVDGQIIYN